CTPQVVPVVVVMMVVMVMVVMWFSSVRLSSSSSSSSSNSSSSSDGPPRRQEPGGEAGALQRARCLPSWLKGTLLRNGPGVFTVGETSYNHWFDGMALMQSFTFKDGEVTYRSRYLKGDTYNANMAAKRIV
ncbi:hypothetical protein CRUP_016416, partial [Coryphaenoides rupestris]